MFSFTLNKTCEVQTMSLTSGWFHSVFLEQNKWRPCHISQVAWKSIMENFDDIMDCLSEERDFQMSLTKSQSCQVSEFGENLFFKVTHLARDSETVDHTKTVCISLGEMNVLKEKLDTLDEVMRREVAELESGTSDTTAPAKKRIKKDPLMDLNREDTPYMSLFYYDLEYSN